MNLKTAKFGDMFLTMGGNPVVLIKPNFFEVAIEDMGNIKQIK